jgi:hypothetical protein
MLLQGIMTVKQAMNIPTCLISKPNDQILQKSGRVKSSPSYWYFFKRYNVLQAEHKTHDGTAIDPDTWTLEKHYTYFKI